MASAVKKKVAVPAKPEPTEKIIDFSPERLRAPFFLRCAAFAVDYIIFLLFPVTWLLFSRLVSESAATVSIAEISWLGATIVTILNFLVLPIWRGQTIGKMLAGITILNVDGTQVGFAGVIRRNLLGYLATALTLGIGFLISAATSSGRSLSDLIGGTVVVRGRKKQV